MRAEHGKLWLVIGLVVLSGYLLPATRWVGEASNELLSPQNFVLTVHEQQLSLRAWEASLTAILHQIGHALGIEVVVRLPADETITVAFDQLPIAEALRQLSPNYAYVMDTTRGDTRLTKIIVLAKGDSTPQRSGTLPATPSPARAARPEPFRFELDPSKARHEGK